MLHLSPSAKRIVAGLTAAFLLAVAACAPLDPGAVGPSATLTEMTMTPATVSLQTGSTQSFAVTGVWSDGTTTAPTVTYNATGGTITAAGLYTAGSTAGTFRVIAAQQSGTLADTSTVTLTAPAPTLTQVILTPPTASIQTGATQQFGVSGVWSDGTTTAPAVTYTATGGTITAAGLYTAGSTAGTFRVIAVQQSGTLADTSTVTLPADAPTLTQVILTPATASLSTGATKQFAVSGAWSDGTTTTPAVTYTATGGTINAAGLYTAGNTAGTFRVIAIQQSGTLADTSTVTLTAAAPTLTQVILTPPTVSVQTGGTQQFAVSGVWSNGTTTAPAVNYTASGGTITTAGLYTAGNTAGTFRVIAIQQSGTLADTSTVTLTAPAPTLTQVILTPPTVSVQAGGTQQFAVSGMWSNGTTTAPAVTYTATGGTITTAGLYTAGSTAGTFRVIAVQQSGTLADTSAVTITAAASTTLFSEGFEDANTSSRGWFDATNVALATDARPGSSGTHALQYHWSVADVAPQGIGTTRHDFTPSNSVYLSYWVKTSANFTDIDHLFYFLTTADDHYIGPSVSHLTTYEQYRNSGGNFLANIEIADVLMINVANIGVDLFGVTENRSIAGANGKHEVTDATSVVGWDQYKNGTQWMAAKYLVPNAAVFTNATKTSWHHVESYEQMNSIAGGTGQPDGVYQYWVDGTLVMDRHNVYFRTGANPTMQFRTFLMGPWFNAGASVDQYLWIDDVVVGTAHP